MVSLPCAFWSATSVTSSGRIFSRTSVGFLSSVSETETCITNLKCEWFSSCMNTQVCVQIWALSESHATDRTTVGFLPGVYLHVPAKIWFPDENLFTNWTVEAFPFWIKSHCIFLHRVSLIAEGAAKWFHSGLAVRRGRSSQHVQRRWLTCVHYYISHHFQRLDCSSEGLNLTEVLWSLPHNSNCNPLRFRTNCWLQVIIWIKILSWFWSSTVFCFQTDCISVLFSPMEAWRLSFLFIFPLGLRSELDSMISASSGPRSCSPSSSSSLMCRASGGLSWSRPQLQTAAPVLLLRGNLSTHHQLLNICAEQVF